MKLKIKKNFYKLKKSEITVVGLGYVGLPLAIEFSKIRKVIGFDLNQKRIRDLKEGHDCTFETSTNELKSAKNLTFTSNIDDIKNSKIFIITVPTPINKYKKPDFNNVIRF